MRAQRVVAITVVLVVLSGAAGVAGAANVAEWGAALTRPVVVGDGVDAKGRTLTFDHLELALEQGRLYPVVALGRVVGVYFHGAGVLTYTCADPVDLPSFRTNVARNTSYAVSAKNSIGDGFGDALIFMSSGADRLSGDLPWPGLDASPLPERTNALAQVTSRFANVRNWRYWERLPQALIDPPQQPWVFAEILGTKHDIQYCLDTTWDYDESIATIRNDESKDPFLKDRRYPEQLSQQLVGRKRLGAKPKHFLVTGYDVNFVNPDGLRAELEVTETFRALGPFTVLPLRLWGARTGQVGVTGQWAENRYSVTGVAATTGQPLTFLQGENVLLVQLPDAARLGDTFGIKFRISGDVLFRPGNLSYWELPTGDWLPRPPLDEEEAATFHAVVKVRKPFVPFSCGQTVRRWEEGDLACAEFSESNPIQLPVILAGKYKTFTAEKAGLVVRVSTYVSTDERAMKKLADMAFAFIEFFKPYLGEFPFKELNIVEIQSLGWGQSPAGLIFITKEFFHPVEDTASQVFSQGANVRFVHELAHAWWGHAIMLGDREDEWISESFAEYFAAYAMGKVRRESEFKRALAEWKGQSRFVKSAASVYTANSLSGASPQGAEDAFRDRYGLLYGKGPLVLHALRQQVGDDTFFTIAKSFVRNFAFKVGETRYVIALSSFVAKQDLAPFFGRYVLGTEWPKD